MKKYLILILFLAFAFSLSAQTSDTGGGEWTDPNTWVGGVAPADPVVTDITISSYVTSNVDIAFATPGNPKNDFIVDDTLIVYGDLFMGLDDDFTVTANAVLIIFGNFEAVNQVTIENGGYFVVLGDFTMTGGAQTSYDNTGDGQTFITGDVDVDVGGGDPVPDLNCDPDFDPDCGYGDISDLVDDPIWDFIDEIDDGVSCSLSASGTKTDETAVGAGDGVIDLTITSSGNPDVEWYLDGALYSISLDITDLNNDGDISGLSSGNYEVFITEGFCSASLSFTVSVACIPPTANDQNPEVCSSVAGENASATVNLTLLETSINGGVGMTYTWYSDAALTDNITATANAQTIAKTINGGAVSATEDYYCVVSDGACNNTATVTYLIYRTPDSGPQFHLDDTWGN
jgi:hypothetical protein